MLMRTNTIIYKATILALVITCSACSNKERTNDPVVVEEQIIVPDTVSVPVKEEVEKSKGESALPVSSSTSSTHVSAPPKYDNMRGLDPASEDDMDDNGMSRYMENNDEEGWD